MKLLQIALPLFFALVVIQGCYRDEIIVPFTPSNLPHKLGVYVLSEGMGASNQSKLSYLSYKTGDFNLNITFPSVLGLYPDGIIESGSAIYITEQGSPGGQGKIYKLDTNGIIYSSNNFGLNPYSIAALNGKAYCSNGPDSSVSVIDLNSLAEIKRIKTGLNPREIISLNNKVYVANTKYTGGGVDSTISVINSLNDLQVAKIKIDIAPSSLAVSKDGYLLAGSSGHGGTIYKVNPNTYEIVNSYSVNSLVIGDINVDVNSNNIFFIKNYSSIMKLDLTSGALTTVIESSSSNNLFFINGYSYDSKYKKHYLADAKDFNNAGFLYKFNSLGVLEAGFQTGISPKKILIRN
ncbi:MAG: YncE family protein [Ignavibacteria bacterium]|nr:YncE family protein [Ignavibacteria bacterium]